MAHRNWTLTGVPDDVKTVTAPPLMLSLSNVLTSLPITIPVPGEPPPVGDAVAFVVGGLPDIEKPSASNAPVSELVTEREFPEVPVCSVIAPVLLTVDASAPLAPVIESIVVSRLPTVAGVEPPRSR